MTTNQPPFANAAGSSNLSRRQLLAAGSGGLLLATTGLTLPTERDTRAAGALDGALGGRRGKNHRGQDKNRNRGQRKKRRRDQDNAKAWPFLDVALYIHNQRATAISVREWVWQDGGEIIPSFWKEQDWKEIPAKPATGPDHFLDFIKRTDIVVVELSTGHVIQAENPAAGFPHITIWSGKWRFDGLDKDSSWEILLNTGLEVNEQRTIAGFQVRRLTDGREHKQFQLNLT